MAPDGRAGLDRARTGEFDLVISDLRMPDVDGFELVSRLRATPGCSDLPVIVLSGSQAKAHRISALDIGADDFLSKPVSADELLARVRLHLRHGSRSRELVLRAVIDELTGVLNRRGATELLERELRRRERSGADLAVLLLDIDGFKEFRLILPDTDHAGATVLANRIGRTRLPVRLSAGTAQARDGDSAESLVTRADAAMYQDKHAAGCSGPPTASSGGAGPARLE